MGHFHALRLSGGSIANCSPGHLMKDACTIGQFLVLSQSETGRVRTLVVPSYLKQLHVHRQVSVT